MTYRLERRTNQYPLIWVGDGPNAHQEFSPSERWEIVKTGIGTETEAKELANKNAGGVNNWNFFQWQNDYCDGIQQGCFMKMAGGRNIFYRIVEE